MYGISSPFFIVIPAVQARPTPLRRIPYRLADPQHGAHVRSYVLTDEAIYGSPLAVQTLVRRYEALLSVE